MVTLLCQPLCAVRDAQARDSPAETLFPPCHRGRLCSCHRRLHFQPCKQNFANPDYMRSTRHSETSDHATQLRFGKVNKDISNTNVFEHAGRVFAVAENHLPQEICIDNLDTGGTWDIGGEWDRHAFTAHPKVWTTVQAK